MRSPSSFFFITLLTSANGISRRHDLVEQHAADRRLDELSCRRLRDAHLDLRLQVDLALVVGDAHFVEARERLALAPRHRARSRVM